MSRFFAAGSDSDSSSSDDDRLSDMSEEEELDDANKQQLKKHNIWLKGAGDSESDEDDGAKVCSHRFLAR